MTRAALFMRPQHRGHSSLLILAVTLATATGCTKFQGDLPTDASDSASYSGFGGNYQDTSTGGSGGGVPGCAQDLCWVEAASPPEAPSPTAPTCNPWGVVPGCPPGFSCTTTSLTLNDPVQGAGHAAAACAPQAGGSPSVVLDVPTAATPPEGAVEVSVKVTVSGQALPAATLDGGLVRFIRRDDGGMVYAALPVASDPLATAWLLPGTYDVRIDLGDRDPAAAPPLPLYGTVEVKATGSVTLDVSAKPTDLIVSVGGGNVGDAEPGGTRGTLTLTDEHGQSWTVELPPNGPSQVRAALRPGSYRVTYDASKTLVLPPQNVLLDEAAELDGGSHTFDLETVALMGLVKVNDLPPPNGAKLVLDTGLAPALEVPIKDGAFTRTCFATPMDLILEVSSGTATAPVGSVMLAKGHTPEDQKTVVLEAETVGVAGTITINGEPMKERTAGTEDLVEVRVAGRIPTAIPMSVHDGSFSGLFYDGPGELWFRPGMPASESRAMQEVRLSEAFTPSQEPISGDIATAALTLQVFVNGGPLPEPTTAGVRGTVLFSPEGEDPDAGPLSVILPPAGDSAVSVPVAHATYDVSVQLFPGDPSYPQVPYLAFEGQTVGSDGFLNADVAVTSVSAALTQGGETPPAQPFTGARGALQLVSTRDEVIEVPLASSGPALATAPLYPGSWTFFYTCEGACKEPLAPAWPIPLVEGLEIPNQ